MRVNRVAKVYGIRAHLDRQCGFRDQIACICPDDAGTDDALVFGIKEQFGDPFGAPV